MIEPILSHFDIPGTLAKAGRFGSGLINETWLVEFDDKGAVTEYILQHINDILS